MLEPDDQALIAGFIVNKFRGDPALLEPGLQQLLEMTGRPTYGVLPYADELWLDAEDSLSVVAHRVVGTPAPPRGDEWLRVAAVRLPRISNSTDVEALACEPGVLVRWITDPADVADTDLIVLPGSKATVADLAWLRERGLAAAIAEHARAGKPVLGICGGFQMLCRRIEDTVESGAGEVAGLGLLDADIAFGRGQNAAPLAAAAHRIRNPPRPAHPIRRGELVRLQSAANRRASCAARSSARTGTACSTTTTSGARWLTGVAEAAGRTGFTVADDTDVVARRDAQLDRIADLLAAHLDVDAVLRLLDGPPPRRPHLVSRLRPAEPAQTSRRQTDSL